MSRKPEGKFQTKLIADIKERLPGAIVLKNDSGYQQGIPDLSIFYKDRWAVLECKAYTQAERQPNQEWFVDQMNGMSYAAFVSPENKEEVLNEIQSAFGVDR